MKALLIAEKNSLMRTIQAVYNKHRNQIGFDIDFMAQAGHLLGLKSPDEINPIYKKWSLDNLPLDVNFRYKTLKGKTNLVRDIRQAVRSGKYDFIIHAGDPDQEGEILIRETLDYVGNTLPVKRFWSNDTTEPAVLHELCHLRPDSELDDLARAGFVRQHEDYIYGMNLTECMSLKSGTLIRMGRVKAPIIKAIVDREREIEEFVPSSTYERAFIYSEQGCDYLFVDESEEFDSGDALMRTVKDIPESVTVTFQETKEKFLKAPKLYKLSSLQTDAFQKLHFPAAKTLSLLQNLYEAQLVTYPRSACEYISSNVDVLSIYGSVRKYVPEISERGLLPRPGSAICADKAYCNDRAIATEGHTAIIPTGHTGNVRGLTEDEKRLYELIVRRFLAVCVPPKKVEATRVIAKDVNGFQYECKGVTDISPSYEYILNPGYQEKQFLLRPGKGDVLEPVVFEPKEIEKKCPARYNEGSLIKYLSNPKGYTDEEGKVVKYTIGTEATRANILEECAKNNYFTRTKGVYAPTEFAKDIVRIYGDLDVFNIDNSAQWECNLTAIRTGETDPVSMESQMTEALVEIIEDLKQRQGTRLSNGKKKADAAGQAESLCRCPKCQSGDIRENSRAFGCSNWNGDPKCDFTLWKSCFGTTLTKTDAKKLIEGKTIEKTLVSKAGKRYKKELALDFDAGRVVWAENLRHFPGISEAGSSSRGISEAGSRQEQQER